MFLEEAGAAARRELEAAVLAGDIRWHALPFTTHTELMTPRLFRHGLGLSQELDRRFGVKTIAAKMSDVTGHTRGIVPLLAEAGVEFLHIGVNSACTAPGVPNVFRWRDPASGAGVSVMYHKENYGGEMLVPGLGDAIWFAHTGDNNGPQTAAEITAQFAAIRERFPGADVRASTLDAFAAALRPVAANLPVVEQEIGDTWIHGAGSDPAKVARFRELQRLLEKWETSGREAGALSFARKLLPVVEHTWGMDNKTHLGDYTNFTREKFDAARARDIVDETPPELHRCYARDDRSYSRIEKSWAEQRAYLDTALDALPADLRREADAALAELNPTPPDTREIRLAEIQHIAAESLAINLGFQNRHLDIRFSPDTGAITRCATTDGTVWCDNAEGFGLLRYQTFSSMDYARFTGDYGVKVEHFASWFLPDVGRPGLAPSDSPSATFFPRVLRMWHGDAACHGTRHVFELAFDPAAHRDFGAPEKCRLEYIFSADRPAVELRVSWFNKPANRMPEAMWCSFRPDLPEADWQLSKLGGLVSPLDVIEKGARNLHAVEEKITCAARGKSLTLATLDAPLVSPGRPRLLEFDGSLPAMRGGAHINLHNNIYSTNFPLWYSGDALFRFRLEFTNTLP